jgi:hypothetical protein
MVDEKKFAEMLMSVEQHRKNTEASYYAMLMRYDKAFMRDEDCLHIGVGEYCVYMWLHADGVPFYVGMGKGNRWKSTNRNERFFEETKKLDTFVCKVISGLNSQQAREAEFCLSHYLSYNGYKLANWDNNYQRSVDEKQADRRVGKFVRLIKEKHNEITVEQAKTKMIPHELPCDYDLMCKWYAMSYGYPA